MSDNKVNSSSLLNPSNARFRGQEKVNAEIFTAIEILGRKLERTEAERNRLADRLEMIESAATLDEETGKIYLPAVIGGNSPTQSRSMSLKLGFLIFTSLVSSVFAVASFSIVLLQNPSFSFEKIIASTTAPAPVMEELTDKEKMVMVGSEDVSSEKTDAVAVVKTDDVNESLVVDDAVQSIDNADSPDESDLVQDVVEEKDEAAEEATVVDPVTSDDDKENSEVVSDHPLPEVIPDHIKVGAERILADEAANADINALIGKTATSSNTNKETAPVIEPVVAMKSQEKHEESVGDVAYDMPADGDLSGTLKKLETAAYSGVAEAQHDLGVYYAEGQMIKQNYKRAVYWLKKASLNGISNASYNLAVMYQQGLGVEKSDEEALKYYNAAAETGHPEAMYNLGIIYFDGRGAKRNIAKGVSFFKRAAEAGVSEAAYNLGVLYESDLMGKPDAAQALKWYRQAAKAGYVKAEEALTRLGSPYAVSKVEKSDIYAQ